MLYQGHEQISYRKRQTKLTTGYNRAGLLCCRKAQPGTPAQYDKYPICKQRISFNALTSRKYPKGQACNTSRTRSSNQKSTISGPDSEDQYIINRDDTIFSFCIYKTSCYRHINSRASPVIRCSFISQGPTDEAEYSMEPNNPSQGFLKAIESVMRTYDAELRNINHLVRFLILVRIN